MIRIATQLAVGSGEALEEYVRETPLVEDHTHMGENLRPWLFVLFLCLLGRHADWSGNLDLFRELRGPAEAALEWIDRYADLDGDGLVEYQRRSTHGRCGVPVRPVPAPPCSRPATGGRCVGGRPGRESLGPR